MMTIGAIHLYVTDFERSLRFWSQGLGLEVSDQQIGPHSAFALLDFPDDGPSLRIFGGAEPWPEGTRPAPGTRPTVRFDLTTTDFDATLLRLVEYGGEKVDPIETYEGLRMVTIADPDGNTFELIELPAELSQDPD